MADTLSAANPVEVGLPYRETADFQSPSLLSPLPCRRRYRLLAARQRQGRSLHPAVLHAIDIFRKAPGLFVD
jgi:hypothetical protein